MDTINKNYSIKWSYKNSQIEMNSKKLKEFNEENNIEDNSPINIYQEIQLKKKENQLEIEEIFGKPLFNPFQILIIQKNKR